MSAARRLEGKVAIVTGAAQGTGAVTARLFVEHGAKVVVADIQQDKGSELAQSLGPDAVFSPLDVRREKEWAATVALAESTFGGLDVLVNNAAVLLLAALPNISRADFLRVVEVNQLGPFLGIQASLDAMIKRGGGSIINISSTDGIKGMNGVSAYASSKWGLRGITKSAAIELGKHAIRVNAVCPGYVDTPMLQSFFGTSGDIETLQQAVRDVHPIRNYGTPEDIANLVNWLAGDEARYCSGQLWVIDGGLTAQVQQMKL